jgi:hypothetical protein
MKLQQFMEAAALMLIFLAVLSLEIYLSMLTYPGPAL